MLPPAKGEEEDSYQPTQLHDRRDKENGIRCSSGIVLCDEDEVQQSENEPTKKKARTEQQNNNLGCDGLPSGQYAIIPA